MKKSMVMIALGILLTVPLASAGFFDFLTGNAVTNVSVSIDSNSLPQIILVEAPTNLVNNVANVSVANINFTAFDYDGGLDINTSSALLNVTRTCTAGSHTGETITRIGSCTPGSPSGQNITFMCPTTMLYYDCPGAYTISAYVKDNASAGASNTSASFTYDAGYGVDVYPGAIGFGAISFDALNVHANQNTTINLTGNMDLATINLTALDLSGESNAFYKLYAANFSASTTRGWTSENQESCTGTNLTNSAPVGLNQVTAIPRNDSYSDTQATQISYCIPTTPGEGAIIKQIYSTVASGPWTITAAF